MKNNIFIRMTKTDDKLVYSVKAMKSRYDKFVNDLPEGANIEIFVSTTNEDGTHAQLARVHVMIRELANSVGYTFEEMKLLSKRKAGLCVVKDKQEYCKSFAECDKEELNLVIQALLEIGDITNTNLR